MFDWRFDTANTSYQNCVKNAFKITKAQSVTQKNTNKFYSVDNIKK